jgi:uncharacterized integral membrane protein
MKDLIDFIRGSWVAIAVLIILILLAIWITAPGMDPLA